MLVAFFDSWGLIHKEYVPTGQTVNANFYKDVLDRLIKRINRICPDYSASGNWFLQHDNSPQCGISSPVFGQKNITVYHQPSCSPDLTPTDYFLFPKLKLQLRGRCIDDIQTIQKNTTDILKGIPETYFKHALEELAGCFQKCINVNGVYIK